MKTKSFNKGYSVGKFLINLMVIAWTVAGLLLPIWLIKLLITAIIT